jgi:hypothetical protein
VSDIDTVVVDSLKALDPEWPIREADMGAWFGIRRMKDMERRESILRAMKAGCVMPKTCRHF